MEIQITVAEMKMLRWMSGVIRSERIRDECRKGILGVTNIVWKIRDNRLRWFKHVERRRRIMSNKSGRKRDSGFVKEEADGGY